MKHIYSTFQIKPIPKSQQYHHHHNPPPPTKKKKNPKTPLLTSRLFPNPEPLVGAVAFSVLSTTHPPIFP